MLYVVLVVQPLLRYLHLFVTIQAPFTHETAPLTSCKTATEGLKEGDQGVRPVTRTESLILLDYVAQHCYLVLVIIISPDLRVELVTFLDFFTVEPLKERLLGDEVLITEDKE